MKYFITRFDMAPFAFVPSLNNRQFHKSFCFGCFSLILWIFFLYIVAIQIYDFSSGNSIVRQSSLETGFFTINDLCGSYAKLKVTFVKGIISTSITKENMMQYGLNITLNRFTLWSGSSIPQMQSYDLYYKSTYFYIHNCEQLTRIKKNDSDLQREQFWSLSVKRCFVDDTQCIPLNKTNFSYMSVQLIFEQRYPYSPIFTSNLGYTLQIRQILYPDNNNNYKGQNIIKYFNKIKKTQDTSIIPNFFSSIGINFTSQVIQEGWYDQINYENTTFNKGQESYTIQTFTFKAGDKVYLIYESQQKIDFILAKIFAVFSLFSLIIFILSSHYKSWLTKIQIMQSLRSNKFSLYKKSLPNYLRFIFCRLKCLKKSEEIKELQEEMEKAVNSLDLIQMRKQIDELKAERALDVKNSEKSFNLNEKSEDNHESIFIEQKQEISLVEDGKKSLLQSDSIK